METTVSSKDVNEKMCTEIGTYYHKSTLLQIREGLSEFVDQDGGIKVRIQWELNYLLFQATFSQNDEVARFHNIQMRYALVMGGEENLREWNVNVILLFTYCLIGEIRE